MQVLADQNLVPVPDAAESSGCSQRTVWYLLARGDITRYKSLNRTYVDVDQLHDLLAPRPA